MRNNLKCSVIQESEEICIIQDENECKSWIKTTMKKKL